ncbi:MAG: DUF697 domain-containing protein [Phycisphaera sp.]|nr:DUF697 domain-containing protein [Phycisphaera sp.]
MTEPKSHPDDHYKRAVESLHETLRRFEKTSASEQAALSDELDQLERLSEKLESGRVDIAVFGEISTGKSALINALAGKHVAEVGVEGGVTRKTGRVAWDTDVYALDGLAESRVELIDTPGINEVAGADRARLAADEARRADLVIFVTDSDLNEIELDTLRTLVETGKPVVLALNKADLYDPAQRTRLLDVLHERTEGLIDAASIVTTTADPLPRQYVIEATDGSSREETRKPAANVADLKVRILELLAERGKAMVALNSMMYAADLSDRLRAVKVRMRDDQAQRMVIGFAVIKGVAVAANPVPITDLIAGFGADAAMVVALGRVYGEKITLNSGGDLAIEIIKSTGWVAAAHGLTHLASGFIKALTVGAGVVLTALPQGLAAAYGSYIVGQASRYYFEHDCGWDGQSPRQVIKEIMNQTDTKSVLQQLRDELMRRLRPGK